MNRCDDSPHVGIYLPSLGGGGAERVMVTLANAFVQRGISVDLVLANAEGPYLKEVSSSVRIINLKSKRVLLSFPSLLFYLWRKRPQVMLTALNHANLIGLIACWASFLPVRIVISERNIVAKETDQSESISHKCVRFLMRKIYGYADGIIAVSQGVADSLVTFTKIPSDKITVVYNPYDVEKIKKMAAEPLNHSWFCGDGVPVILGIGRLTEQKDFTSLIKAFAKIRKVRQVRLMILGDGEQRDELISLAKSLGLGESEFCLNGFVSNPFNFLANSSIFVLSSKWEGLPNVLIQALVCCPRVVSTNCLAGPSEILENGKWGRLVDVGDFEKLAGAILDALSDDISPSTYVRACEFGIDRAVDGYLKVMLPEIYDK